MGDQIEGSSSAAQSAREIEVTEQTEHKGMLGRFLASFTPDKSDIVENGTSRNGTANGHQVPGIANLGSKRVVDVAIPMVEIVAVPVNIKKDDLVDVFRESGLTRLPVYDGTLDTPLGFVHLKDFSLKHGFGANGGRFSLRPLIRPLIYAPPSMGIGVLLQKMQTERVHMALVIDEYGGVDGLVTIEDLIEQVVGEIEDEHDAIEGDMWVEDKPGSYTVSARAGLEEFESEIGQVLTPEDEEEIDTLGGLVVVMSGRVPARGEMIPHPSGVEFEVLDADPRRIKRLRVMVPGRSDG